MPCSPKESLWLCKAIPAAPVPLRRGEQEGRLPLGQLLTEMYDRVRYDRRLDYRQPPEVPLAAPDGAGANELLRARGLR